MPSFSAIAAARMRRLLVPIFRSRASRRLQAEISVFEQKFAARRTQGTRLKVAPERIGETLEHAKEALKAGDIDSGWRQLQSAQRLLLPNLQRGAELSAEVVAMRAEVEKLSGWRKCAAEDLLHGEPSVENLVKAAEIRDEHYNNQAYKDGIQRSRMAFLALALVSAVSLLFAWIKYGGLIDLIDSYAENAESVALLFGVCVVGLLGASVSAITHASRSQGPARIPEMVASLRVTLLRLMMGPASAIVILFAIQSNFYDSIFKLPRPNGPGLLVIVFAAGFSERLVLRVVELVAGRSE